VRLTSANFGPQELRVLKPTELETKMIVDDLAVSQRFHLAIDAQATIPVEVTHQKLGRTFVEVRNLQTDERLVVIADDLVKYERFA
jgi:hypothetical protein